MTKINKLENELLIKISAGNYSGALNKKGELFVWGSGVFGEFLHPRKLDFLENTEILDFLIGGFSGFAIDKNNYGWAWGNNDYGQLGYKEYKHPIIKPLPILNGIKIEKIFCSNSFTFFITKGIQK